MPQGNPKPGERYMHFKKKLYQVITIAEHSETQEPLVIYQALYGNFKVYARPLAMFLSPVDTEKYPDAGQLYRFQIVTDDETIPEGLPTAATGSPINGSQTALPTGTPAAETSADGDNAELSPEDKLMAFFDAETMDEKYKLLLDMRNDVTDRMINNMAVVLDVVIEEGPLDQRYEELKTCVRTFRRYETSRLR
ncbi:MAG: DUF1653 domain-containing protein [Lachnospiraceae bacterium]|jgi:hypothetical protein|nr:DUF1653 domain-containing protein [Lachnospiraceae bacterium]